MREAVKDRDISPLFVQFPHDQSQDHVARSPDMSPETDIKTTSFPEISPQFFTQPSRAASPKNGATFLGRAPHNTFQDFEADQKEGGRRGEGGRSRGKGGGGSREEQKARAKVSERLVRLSAPKVASQKVTERLVRASVSGPTSSSQRSVL